MNKQELIDELKRRSDIYVTSEGRFLVKRGKELAYMSAVKLAEKLEEPKKPVVPQFVADWFEEYTSDFFSAVSKKEIVLRLGYDIQAGEISDDDIEHWLSNNADMVVDAALNGYEIEKIPVYKAKSKLSEMSNWGNDEEDYFTTLVDLSSERVWLGKRYFAIPLTREDWNKRGITDELAIFEEVTE